jgi:hypothetical protein
MLKRYLPEDELNRALLDLKLTACPHCGRVGTLNLHGWLRGYDEANPDGKAARARRVFCNNRRKHGSGCGGTFTIWIVDKLRRSCLGAQSLWKFLKGVVTLNNKSTALRGLSLAPSSAYRIWNRFRHGQTKIRSFLFRICPPPQLANSDCPATQTVAHLEAAFPNDGCPIVAFQKRFQSSFT